MHVLVTGGAGYIGSHTAKRLLAAGHSVVLYDDLSRGNRGAVDALRAIAPDRVSFVEADIRDKAAAAGAMREHGADAVMHFAALAYVRESVHAALAYHAVNTCGAIALLEACEAAGVERFVFSSTCATYGEPPADRIPIDESCPQSPINPYGWSKLHVERVLRDHQETCLRAGKRFAFAALRYFNVAGADPEGVLGEWHDPETHLIPIAIEAAMGRRQKITVFGTDLDTKDGSCVRDYIHVDDVARAHVLALDALDPQDGARRRLVYNLGNGQGFSVLEIIDAVRRVSGAQMQVEHAPRNPADPPVLTADASKIRRELGWAPQRPGLDDIVRDAWDWLRAHPRGYGRG